jgi:hypothetical protein
MLDLHEEKFVNVHISPLAAKPIFLFVHIRTIPRSLPGLVELGLPVLFL